jgi:hypothetical protein
VSRTGGAGISGAACDQVPRAGRRTPRNDTAATDYAHAGDDTDALLAELERKYVWRQPIGGGRPARERVIVQVMAAKLKVIPDRAEARDYRDIAEMIAAGVSLSRIARKSGA